MQDIIKLVNDVFSMSFDIIIPVSGCIVAVLTAVLFFSIRYFTFRRKVKKYEGQPKRQLLTPRTGRPKQAAEGHAPLEAAKYCDESIYRFLTDAGKRRAGAPNPDAKGQVDRRFYAEMTSQLRGKAPPAEAEGTVK